MGLQVLRLASETDTGDVNSIPAALSQPSSSSQYVRPGMILDSSLNGGLKVTDYRIEELNEPPPRLPGVRALLPLSGGAGLLTGGSDCCIHMWDHSRYNQIASVSCWNPSFLFSLPAQYITNFLAFGFDPVNFCILWLWTIYRILNWLHLKPGHENEQSALSQRSLCNVCTFLNWCLSFEWTLISVFFL